MTRLMSGCSAERRNAIRRLLSGAAAAATALSTMVRAAQDTAERRYAFVSHAPDSDTWWNTIRNALAHASEDYGIQVDYLNPKDGSIDEMAHTLRGISPTRYSAVISTIADFRLLQEPLADIARHKHLPLITVNSGTTLQSEQVGALMHIGQPEFDAGRAAGEEARKAGVRSAVCFNHYPQNAASHERCNGFAAGLGLAGPAKELVLEGSAAAIEQAVRRFLSEGPLPDAVLTLGPTGAHPTLAALTAMKALPGKPMLVTFDLSTPITQGVRGGGVAFAIDQQPYLQGYLPVALLREYLRRPDASINAVKLAVYANEKLHMRMARYGISLKPADRAHINSGPGFVTKVNVQKVERYSGQFR